MKNFLFYHDNCPDGLLAAVIFEKHFPGGIQTIPLVYGGKSPLDLLREAGFTSREDTLFFVDICPKPEVIVQIQDAFMPNRMVVIDHHKSANEDLDPKTIVGNAALCCLSEYVYDVKRSGAGLAWDYLAVRVPEMGKRPNLVNYVEDRDTWAKALPHSDEVTSYVSSFPLTKETFLRFLAEDATFVADALVAGPHIMRYRAQVVDHLAKRAFRLDITGNGQTVPVTSAPPMLVSEVGAALCADDDDEPFAVMFSHDREGRYSVSLRSRNPDGADVSAIARRFGGGGHKHAAAFRVGFAPPMVTPPSEALAKTSVPGLKGALHRFFTRVAGLFA